MATLYTQQDKNVRKTGFLMAEFLCLIVVLGYFISYYYNNPSIVYIALVFAMGMNIFSYWYSDRIALSLARAHPADRTQYPDLFRSVENLSITAGLPMPRLYIITDSAPNAFATGRSHRTAVVAVTRGITEILDNNELRSVLAHELGHVKNRDMLVSTIAATVGGAIAILAEMAFWGGAFFGGGDEEEGNNFIGSLAMMILAPFAALLIQMAVSRSREYLADQHGKHLVGNGNDLASALQKLEDFKPKVSKLKPTARQDASAHLMFMNMFSAQGLASLFATHPSTKSRIEKLTTKEQ